MKPNLFNDYQRRAALVRRHWIISGFVLTFLIWAPATMVVLIVSPSHFPVILIVAVGLYPVGVWIMLSSARRELGVGPPHRGRCEQAPFFEPSCFGPSDGPGEYVPAIAPVWKRIATPSGAVLLLAQAVLWALSKWTRAQQLGILHFVVVALELPLIWLTWRFVKERLPKGRPKQDDFSKRARQ